MLANCDHAGLFKVNLRSFRGQVEVKVTSNEALQFFNNGKDRIRVISETLWYIEDFFVFQYGTSMNLNNRLHNSIAELLEKQKIELTSIRGLVDLKVGAKEKDKVINSIIDTKVKLGENGEKTEPEFSGNYKARGEELLAYRLARGRQTKAEKD